MARAMTVTTVLGALLLCFAFFSVDLARHKWFWADEATEISQTCTQPVSQMLVQGARYQCSPQPFYYIAQKLNLRLLGTPTGSHLIQVRALSLLSAFVCLALTFLFVRRYIGLGAATVATASLFNQHIFLIYAAENRPYMPWLALSILLLAQTDLLLKPTDHLPRWRWPAFYLTAFLLIGTVAPGLIQFCLLVAVAAAIYFWQHRKLPWPGKHLFGLIGFTLLMIAMTLYYSKGSCTDWNAGTDSLLKSLQNGDLTLVKRVLRLLISNAWSVTWLTPVLVLLGLAYSIACIPWGRNETAAEASRDFFRQNNAPLVVAALATLFAFFCFITLVTIRNYYFTPRLFITVVLAAAMLAALGWSKFEQLLADRLSPFYAALTSHSLVAVYAVFSVLNLAYSQQEIKKSYQRPDQSELICNRLISRKFHVGFAKSVTDSEALNLLVQLGDVAYARKCKLPAKRTTWVWVEDTANLTRTSAYLSRHKEGKNVSFCGHPNFFAPSK